MKPNKVLIQAAERILIEGLTDTPTRKELLKEVIEFYKSTSTNGLVTLTHPTGTICLSTSEYATIKKLVLAGGTHNKIQAIKALRDISRCGLHEAKCTVENTDNW